MEGFDGSRTFNTPPRLSPSPTRYPLRNLSPSPPSRSRKNYDERGIGINIKDSLGVLGLEMGVIVREVYVPKMDIAR